MSHRISSWWSHCFKDPKFTKKNRLIVKLLLNTQRRGKHRCLACEFGTDSIVHILFECPSIDQCRRQLYSEIENRCPPALVQSLSQLNNLERCVIFINGLNCAYIHEWKRIYDSISNFLYGMIVEYDNQCDRPVWYFYVWHTIYMWYHEVMWNTVGRFNW